MLTLDDDKKSALLEQVQKNKFWSDYLKCLSRQEKIPFSIHLGVFVEPFLQYILDGKKTIETRFSVVRCAPYKRVNSGDVLILKRSGGPIVGLSQIRSVWFYKLENDSWDEIKTFAHEICAEDPSFWENRKSAAYATLMRLQNVFTISNIPFSKKDRRGWVVLSNYDESDSLFKEF